MRHLALVITILVAAVQAGAFSYWNDIRASALLPGDTVTIRTETAHGPGLVNTILYAQGGVQEVPLVAVDDGPSTLEATVPGPVSQRRWYGFRLEQGSDIDLLPVRLPAGATPAPGDLTLLADDPTGDADFGYVNLDLTGCRLGRDDTRLYAAVSNAGGGFPVNSGLTFFSYLLGINNPAVADPDTVLAMIQTIDSPGIVEPGLYQINGTGLDDLVRIGDITATEFAAENTLVLSCDLADLEANPFFQGWYDPADPRVGVAAFSQRITILGGAQEADRTPGGVWHLREVGLDPGPNALPQLADLVVPAPGSGGAATVVYTDANAHCPVIDELDIDGVIYPLRPQSLDYLAPVTYASDAALPPLEDGTWMQVVARFSDDASNLVELAETAVGVGDARTGLQLRAAPNPFGARTSISFALRRTQPVRLALFDVAGRRVATLVDGPLPAGSHVREWDGRDEAGRLQPAGVYVFQLQTAQRTVVRRLTLMR